MTLGPMGQPRHYVRDAFAMETARAMGMIAPHTTLCTCTSTASTGASTTRRAARCRFLGHLSRGDKNTWDAINQDSVPTAPTSLNRLLALLDQDPSRTEVYQQLQGNRPDGTRNPDFEDLLDVENMIDYLILNFYVGNTDWPGGTGGGKRRNNGDGFHFYPWDTETALGSPVGRERHGSQLRRGPPYAAVRANTSSVDSSATGCFDTSSMTGRFS